jgi:protein-disulfide isomerase
MQKGQAKMEINKDYALGNKFKVMGTPTFFVNGIKVEGLVKWEEWDKFLKGI